MAGHNKIVSFVVILFTVFVFSLLQSGVASALQEETCFPAGTMITMADGSKLPIEEVRPGDLVLSYDLERDAYVSREVLFFDDRHHVSDHAEGSASLGDEPSLYTINDGLVEFTPEHPFLVKEGGVLKWVALVPDMAQHPQKGPVDELTLRPGQEILVNDTWTLVESVSVSRRNVPDTPVYNLVIADTHTYIADDVVVHNKDCTGTEPGCSYCETTDGTWVYECSASEYCVSDKCVDCRYDSDCGPCQSCNAVYDCVSDCSSDETCVDDVCKCDDGYCYEASQTCAVGMPDCMNHYDQTGVCPEFYCIWDPEAHAGNGECFNHKDCSYEFNGKTGCDRDIADCEWSSGSCDATSPSSCLSNADCAWGCCDDRFTCYEDSDDDDFGNPSITQQSTCSGSCPSGYVSDDSDCDDSEADAYPGNAPDECDGINNDCDGSTDEDASCGSKTCTAPRTFGSCTNPCEGTSGCGSCSLDCSCDSGYAACDGSKTDGDGCEVNLNTDDNNCGSCGNDCGANAHCSSGSCACDSGWTDANNDLSDGCETSCDADGDGALKPSCGGSDCDDSSDCLAPGRVWYHDADGDGYVSSTDTKTQCSYPGAGWFARASACSDE